MREAIGICEACNKLYDNRPGDDTTVACIRVRNRQIVHLMTGPAKNSSDDRRMVADFMSGDASVKRIVSGGTSASIVSRVLNRPMAVSLDYDPDIGLPPMGEIQGIDLVTEGVLTLAEVLRIIKQYADLDSIDREFFKRLERPNPADRIARILIEQCTEEV